MGTEFVIVETHWRTTPEEAIAAVLRLNPRLRTGELLQGNRVLSAGESLAGSGQEQDKFTVQARLADVARQEEKRRRLQAFLERETPAWNPDDHPEIDAAGGAAAWVKKMRREADRASLRRSRRARP